MQGNKMAMKTAGFILLSHYTTNFEVVAHWNLWDFFIDTLCYMGVSAKI